MNISQLAGVMGKPESDVQRFVDCLRIWTDKGYTLEEAIAKNEEQMMRIVRVFHNLPTEDKKDFVINAFFPD